MDTSRWRFVGGEGSLGAWLKKVNRYRERFVRHGSPSGVASPQSWDCYVVHSRGIGQQMVLYYDSVSRSFLSNGFAIDYPEASARRDGCYTTAEELQAEWDGALAAISARAAEEEEED